MPWHGETYPGEFPSLGWALIDLIEEDIPAPDGSRLRLTDRQVEWTVRLHRIDPETGEWFYLRGVKEGPKGDGKSPLLGCIAYGHLVGPVVFDGWDAAGEPVGRPHDRPWIQIAALAEDQTDNCYQWLRQSLAESAACDERGIDLGLSRIVLKDRPGKLEGVTSAAGTREGQQVTFAGKEELQYWTPPKGGPKLNRTLNRNVAKMNGLSMGVTNAFRRGEESVAEAECDAAEMGAPELLYEAYRGPFVEDLSDSEAVRASIDAAYDPQAWWVPKDRLVRECADRTIPPGEARRFYFNIPDEFAGESWLPEGEWERHRRHGRTVNRDQPFVGALDMALKHDTAALRLAQMQLDGLVVVESIIWTPNGGVIDIESLEAELIRLHATGNLQALAYDPAYFERSAQALYERGLPVEEFPQSPSRMAPACAHAYEIICSGQVVHDDDQQATSQVTSAVPTPAGEGWRLTKRAKTGQKPPKIDSAIALVMALDVLTKVSAPEIEFVGGWR